MRLDSARGLKQQLLKEVVAPFSSCVSRLRRMGAGAVSSAAAAVGIEDGRTVFGIGAGPFATVSRIRRSIALGISRDQNEYRLAVRVQRPSLVQSALMERLTRQANGEVDVRMIGRIDKRAKARRVPERRRAFAAAIPWYQHRPDPC